MRSRARAWTILSALGPLVAYGGLVCWLTWPLAAAAAASLPFMAFFCQYDILYSAWVLAHESHALATAPATFPHANIYHPAPGALFYGPAGLGALSVFAPVFLASDNPALAINVTFLLGLVLTATTMHVVVRRWTGSDLAGLVGATTLLFNQWILWQFVPTAPHWAALFLFPVIAFTAATPFDSLRSSLRLLPLVVLQCLTDLVYTTTAVLTPLGVLALLRIARRRLRAAGLRLAAVLALAVLVLLPVYGGYLTVHAANPGLAQQTPWRFTEITLPTPLLAHVLAGSGPFVMTSVAAGLVAVGLLARVWRRRQGASPPVPGGWAHGALWTIVGGCLAQMPRVVIAGKTWTTPLGYLDGWLHFYQTIRVPSRLGIAGLVGLGILSGVAFAEIADVVRARLRRPAAALVARMALAAIVVSLLYRAYATNYVVMRQERPLPAAYPLQAAPTIPPGILEVLRSSPGPLLELPLGPGTIAYCDHALAMYHSIAHWRPLLNGYSSYWPEGFPERMALANRLPDQDALDDLVRTTGLSMIWLHAQRLTTAQQLAWTAPRRAGGGHAGLALVRREGPEWLYAVVPPTAAAPAS